MNVATRRRWIIGANTILILFYVYGFYSEITFRNPLEQYLGRAPMPQVLAQILQEKKWSLAAAMLLILGLAAEFLQKRVAAFVNTAAYVLILVIFICDLASSSPPRKPRSIGPALVQSWWAGRSGSCPAL
jgi:hypothetical protein